MVDKNLIQRLHDKSIIDKRKVLWWQLGFEGRRIFSEEEFSKGLETKTLRTGFDPRTYKRIPENTELDFQFWKRHDVPILLRKIKFSEKLEIPCFISVKPLSHESNPPTERYLIPQVYLHPHIRGALIEKKDNFLFWYPFSFGIKPEYYQTRAIYLKEVGMECLINPIHPTKFYQNLIRDGWSHGRRAQKKAEEFDCRKEGYEIVPYFEFDTSQRHVTVYPVTLFEKKLDFPVFIKSSSQIPYVEIIGIGYACFDNSNSGSIYYWNLPGNKRKVVKHTLEQALS